MLRKIKHGEMLIVEVAKLPKGLKQKNIDKDYLVIGESETHGNDHRIAVKDKNEVIFYEDDKGNLYMKNLSEAKVYCPKREKHHDVEIPNSIWEIKKALEWDYVSNQKREVRD